MGGGGREGGGGISSFRMLQESLMHFETRPRILQTIPRHKETNIESVPKGPCKSFLRNLPWPCRGGDLHDLQRCQIIISISEFFRNNTNSIDDDNFSKEITISQEVRVNCLLETCRGGDFSVAKSFKVFPNSPKEKPKTKMELIMMII